MAKLAILCLLVISDVRYYYVQAYSCSVENSELGEKSAVTCHFDTNVQENHKDFTISHRRNDGRGRYNV
jgi:hypothetical protein